MSIAALSQMPFVEACENWLESRKHHIAPRTYLDYSNYIKQLSEYFGSVRLPDIDGDMMRSYQHDRSKEAAPETINKELGVVVMARKRINRPFTKDEYQRLQQSKEYESPGRALTPSEEAALERTCKTFAKHKTWGTAALCLLLAMRTGMTRGEILSLKLKDITLGEPSRLEIPRRGAKRVSRERVIALIGDAEWCLQNLLERAAKAGSVLPDHFLIPATNRDHSSDPTRPAKSYRTGVEKLLAVAEIKIRPNDMRHHAMSRALSNPGVSLAMARSQFGHVSNKMQGRYYHESLENLVKVARAMEGEKKPVQNAGGYQRNPMKAKSNRNS